MQQGDKVEFISYNNRKNIDATETGEILEVKQDKDIGEYYIIKPDKDSQYERVVRTPAEITRKINE